jgi:ribosomal protein S6--L-glutamate ligase
MSSNPYFVSFHPQIPLEVNLAQFDPLDTLEAQSLVTNAAGVLLPVYLTPRRFGCIAQHARDWFPRLDVRHNLRGKIRQIRLFRQLGVRHPESLLFSSPSDLLRHLEQQGPPWDYPMVLKGDTGGGGSSVFPLHGPSDLVKKVGRLPQDEPALLQRWVNHGGRDLRVVVYGRQAISYFRVGDGQFYNNVCRGGRTDHEGWPEDQARGIRAVHTFCDRTGIDLAGFDLMFPDQGDPVFVEVNFHFGRKGLGGTPAHRQYFLKAVEEWRTRRLHELTRAEGIHFATPQGCRPHFKLADPGEGL